MGTFTSTLSVRLEHINLPEFTPTRFIDQADLRVTNYKSQFDIILGRDLLHKMKLSMNFDSGTMSCFDNEIPMKDIHDIHDSIARRRLAEDLINNTIEHQFTDVSFENDDDDELFAADIKSSDYHEVSIKDVTDKCTHLDEQKRKDLFELLSKYKKLFSGKLGKYPHQKVHLDVDPNATPKAQKAFPVPRAHLQVFKEELDRLEEIGVLEKTGPSRWISPTFIIPKKDGRVRWVSDFRALNKVIRRKIYPLPRITDLLNKRFGYKFISKLDISMQYYTFELDDESADKCTIATPFGLYKYKRLPMGICQSPDISQHIMEQTLCGLDCQVYLDDVAASSLTWKEHLKLLDQILQRLEDNGFTVNPAKCEWAVQETDWLGYWMTPTGLKPWKKKVQAILNMKAPTDITSLRSFIGSVNYYRDMWPKRAEILAPLTELTGKKFEWNEECEQAFKRMKSMIATDALLRYPDPNLDYEIETDASDYQLGAVIKQNGIPVAYYSRKLNKAQQNYTTIEKELLSIVETLREFRTLLLGSKIHIFTDHKNLTYEMSRYQTQRVLRWRLLIEEFGPIMHYITGKKNVLADCLSRVPTSSLVGENKQLTIVDEKQNNISYCAQSTETQDDAAICETLLTNALNNAEDYEDYFYSLLEDLELLECLLLHPIFDEEDRFPLNFETIQLYQQQDAKIARLRHTPLFFDKEFPNGITLLCVGDASNWSIVLTDEMADHLIDWYHLKLSHNVGTTRLYETIRRHFFCPSLKTMIADKISKCERCQQSKILRSNYGQTAPRDVAVSPWQEVHVDTIGPWKLKAGPYELFFNALTIIDPVTNLLEIVRISSKEAKYMAQMFENNWLARYPRPLRCIYDQGGEFKGLGFQQMLRNNGMKKVPISSQNPQSNGIIERVHQSIGNVICTNNTVDPPADHLAANEAIDNILATAMHATRVASSRALQYHSPGEVAFYRDMMLDIPLIADLIHLKEQRQLQVDERLLKANVKRISHDYQPGQSVWKRKRNPDKLEDDWEGPYQILQVHTNGTLTIQLDAVHSERINIRRVKPHKV